MGLIVDLVSRHAWLCSHHAMATFPRITSRSSSLGGTRCSDDNAYFGRAQRTPYPDTSSDETTLARSITNSSGRSCRQYQTIPRTESTSSASQTLPPSPLDNIPSSLYTRFPRFSMTTEISQPDLSIEDVTSTRFSVDEEGIVAIPFSSDLDRERPKRPSRVHRSIRKAISHQAMFLKQARVGVRRVPSRWGLIGRSKEMSGHPPSSQPGPVRRYAFLWMAILT